MQLTNIAVDNLTQDSFNPRRTHDEKTLAALATSIGVHGIIEPLIVRPLAPNGHAPVEGVVSLRHSVLCGSRRLAAGKRAGLTEVPCLVRTADDVLAAELALTEQGSHETLHYLEVGEALQRWKEVGASVEEMGKKIDRKRATVYSLMGLAKLTPEAKRACWDKKLEEIAARELATYPARMQGQALKEMLSAGDDGKPRSAREQIELLRSRYRLDLKKAGFDPADKSIAQEACGSPSCTECPHRTGVSPDLFEEGVNEDLCSNRPGYQARQDARWAQMVEDGAHARGPRCLPDSEAKKLLTDRGLLTDTSRFLRLDDVCHEDTKSRTLRELLPAGPTMLARAPVTRAVVELVERQGLTQRLDEAGRIKRHKPVGPVAPTGDELSKEAKKALEKKNERRDVVTASVMTEVASKLKSRGPDKKLMRFLCDYLVHLGSLERIWTRRDVQEEPSKYLDRLSESELLAFFVEGVVEPDLYPTSGEYTPTMRELAKLLGVDVKEHEREVVAAEKVQPKVKKGGGK